jgi:hypothetical protein
MNTPSLPRCLVAQLSVRLFAGLLGDRAAALGLNSRVRGLSHSRAGFENKRRVAAETWDRCGELSLPVIDRTAASHQALRASAKTSHRLKEHGRPAHWSCFDVGGTPTLLEFSARFRFSSLARAAALAVALLASPALLVNQASAVLGLKKFNRRATEGECSHGSPLPCPCALRRPAFRAACHIFM